MKKSSRDTIVLAQEFHRASNDLARVIIFEILTNEIIDIRSQFEDMLSDIQKRYEKSATGLGIQLNQKEMNRVSDQMALKFSIEFGPLNLMNLSDLKFDRLKMVPIQRFLDRQNHKGQRESLRQMYIYSLGEIRRKFASKFGKESDVVFKEFIRQEIYANEKVSNFLKKGKEKTKKNSEEESYSGQSFELFHKAILKSLQRDKV